MTDAPLPALDAVLSTYSGYADLANLTIAVGLAIEFGALLWFSERMSSTEKRLLLLGGVLVLAGAAAEYDFGGKLATTAAQLQQRSNEKIELAHTAVEAAHAELARLTAPRVLTEQQQSDITDAVRAFTGQRYTIGVTFEPESDKLRVALSKALDDAGWLRMPPLGEVMTPDGHASIVLKGGGVRIQVAPSMVDELQPRAELLAAALRKNDIASKVTMNPELEGNGAASLNIVVGSKSN